MVRHTGIIEELRLDECGLRYLDCDPWAFAPYNGTHGQQAITFSTDLARTCNSIADTCGDRDADAYESLPSTGAPATSRSSRLFSTRRRCATWASGCGMSAGQPVVKAAWRCRGSSCSRPTSCSTSTFTDERLKTALSWLGAQSGPPTHEVATADLVGWNMRSCTTSRRGARSAAAVR